MWIRNLALLLLVGLALAESEAEAEAEAQEEAATGKGTLRRLRLRRPRPVSISDPDGIAEGRPIPLRRIPQGVPVDQLVSERQNTADLLAAALDAGDDDLQFEQGQSLQSTDALQSLLATAAAASPEPFIPEYEDLVEEQLLQPIAAVPRQRQQQVQQEEAPRGRVPSGRTRRPPGVPRRVRPRPDNEQKGQRQPNERDRENSSENVGTVERYSHTNDDGSFTFGYISEDGSFREETRGVDCITKGKYGYIDPDGKRREFTYVSGLPCEIGEEGEIDEDVEEIEDPIDPSDRFRTSQAVQLSEDEIPDSARPQQRQPVRPPVNNAGRIRDPAVANRRPRPQAASLDTRGQSPLDSLLSVADGAAAGARRPAAAARRPANRPAAGGRRPSVPARGAFNFDSELDSFTLNKPALTFAQQPAERPKSAQGAPAASPTPVGPSFSSELVFNPATGTFQTELRQGVAGGSGEIRLSNAAAPSGRQPPTATPRPAARPPTPTAVRTSFSPTPVPQGARPTPFTAFNTTPRPTAGAAPGSQIKFEGLSFPDPGSVLIQQTPAPRPPTPSPTPSRPAPAPTTPSRPPPPRPTPVAARPPPTQPANSIFFQPRPQPQRPPTPAARPPPPPRPAGTLPANTFTLGAAPTPGQRPANPGQPVTLSARPPAPPAAQPVRQQPQIQFGFQPVQQGRPQTQGTPFTAFNAGVPQQLRGVPPQQQQFRPQQQFQPQQQFRPQQQFQPQQQFRPQPQTSFGRPPAPAQFGAAPRPGQPQQLGVPPQLQQGARFQPQARPPPQQQSSPFTVFNPAQFRG